MCSETFFFRQRFGTKVFEHNRIVLQNNIFQRNRFKMQFIFIHR
jgi:hypothetical protein